MIGCWKDESSWKAWEFHLPDAHGRERRAPVPWETGLLLSDEVDITNAMLCIRWTLRRYSVWIRLAQSLRRLDWWREDKLQSVLQLQYINQNQTKYSAISSSHLSIEDYQPVAVMWQEICTEQTGWLSPQSCGHWGRLCYKCPRHHKLHGCSACSPSQQTLDIHGRW